MIDSLKVLLANRPSDFSMVNLADDDPASLFCLRWEPNHFKNISEFNEFTQRFSTVMQFLGPDYEDVDISPHFHEDPAWKSSADHNLKNHPPISRDACDLIREFHPEVNIPWLEPQQYSTAMLIPNDEHTDIVAKGASGFFTAFVSDDVDFEF